MNKKNHEGFSLEDGIVVLQSSKSIFTVQYENGEERERYVAFGASGILLTCVVQWIDSEEDPQWIRIISVFRATGQDKSNFMDNWLKEDYIPPVRLDGEGEGDPEFPDPPRGTIWKSGAENIKKRLASRKVKSNADKERKDLKNNNN